MVVEQHPTLLNVTLHPAKVGQGAKVKNQTWYRRRPRPRQTFSTRPLWRESNFPSSGGVGGGGGGSGGSNNSSSSSNSSRDNVAGNGVRLVGSGGDRGEIGHSDGDGGGEPLLTEDDVKGQDTSRVQQWLPVQPYTYYIPGNYNITDIPHHMSSNNTLHIRAAHFTLEDWHKDMKSGVMEVKPLIHILYFATPLFSLQVFL